MKQAPSLDALSFDIRKGLSGGVESQSPQSSRDEYAESGVRRQVSLLGGSSQLATSLDPIELVFSVTRTGGVSNALDALFQSFSAWSTTPGDVNARKAVLNAAAQVAAAFGQSAAQLDKVRASVNSGLQTTLAAINQIAGDIRQYNIAKGRSSTPDA